MLGPQDGFVRRVSGTEYKSQMNKIIARLKTAQDVRDWLAEVVTTPPPRFAAEEVSDNGNKLSFQTCMYNSYVLTFVHFLDPSSGANFPFCAPNETKQQLYRAALDCFSSAKNKEKLRIPFINGAPGIGKTRMLIESLNILKVRIKRQLVIHL